MGTNSNLNFSTGSLTGFNAGVMMELPVSYPFSVQPEAMFSQKGFAAVTVNGNFTQRTQFLDVPILGKFNLNHVFNFYIGPQFSYLAGLKNTYHEGFNATTETFYDNTSNRLFYAGVIGASLNVTQNIELRARYTIDLQQNYSNGNGYVPSYSNQVVQFGLGYKF
jgi:opacity protein-like surface antigen